MNKKGFTLFEIIIVMGVIAVLFTLGIAGFLAFTKSARDRGRINKGNEIVNLINDYRKQNLRYPTETDVVFTSTSVEIGEFSTDLQGSEKYATESTSDSTRYYYTTDRSGFIFCVLLESGSVESLGTGECPSVSTW